MPLSGEDSPSILAVPPRSKQRRLAAKAWTAAKESKADQREAKAEMLGPRGKTGAALERRPREDEELASGRLSERAPWFCARVPMLRRCCASAAPAVPLAALLGVPAKGKAKHSWHEGPTASPT